MKRKQKNDVLTVYRVADRMPKDGEVICVLCEFQVDGVDFRFTEIKVEWIYDSPDGYIPWRGCKEPPKDCPITPMNAEHGIINGLFPEHRYVLAADVDKIWKKIPKGSI